LRLAQEEFLKFSGSWNATTCARSQRFLATHATSVDTIVDRNPA
jgi:hypothetical protein